MENPASAKLKQLIQTYEMPDQGAELLNKFPPLVLSGITAAGKETIAARIQRTSNYRQTTNHTTRPPRPGEKNGLDYWFVNAAEMIQLLEERQMFEASLVHGETVYGSSIPAYQEVLDSGEQPLIVMDVQGIDKLLARAPNLNIVFLLPPDYTTWFNRLNSRGEMLESERLRRFGSALMELEHVVDRPEYKLILNTDVDQTAEFILSGKIGELDRSKNLKVLSDLKSQITKVIHR